MTKIGKQCQLGNSKSYPEIPNILNTDKLDQTMCLKTL